MRSTFRILFYPKKGAPLKNGKLPIMLRITIDGDKVEFSTKLEIEGKKWDTRTGKVSGRTPVANEMNLKLDRIRVELNSHYDKFREVGSYPTPLMLKNAYLGIQAKSHTMLNIFKKIVDEKKKLLGVSIVKSTCDKYELVYHRLQEYIKQEYQNNDLPLSSIDDDFVNGFERYLRADKKIGHNATAKMMQKLKTATNYAKAHGMLSIDPFYDTKITFKNVDVPYLTLEELRAIMDKDIQNDRLRRVRDIFVFSCFTGLAYSDTYFLTEEHLYKANDGKMWIKKHRQKTKVIADIPLLEVPLQILNKYRGKQTGGRLLPVSSNQKVNEYLKELATICGIKKELTYHMARYTFATSLTLLHNVPMASIAKMLGHTNIRQTQHYAKVNDVMLSRNMQNLSEQLDLRMEIK
ncbi:site-specific integrase [Bacteroides fragilis]|uniref:site-specific integrase n=1 Tax=Bacteroides fragilis TaxID=817 RepID=UPI00202E4BD5|nr:site-specific integrase [Bacteroides fragilis]MCM0347361.1 site-specific integrase [Bacteroides fragilis]